MQVSLISYTPNPELIIAVAARSSAANLSAAELWDTLKPQQVQSMVKQLLERGRCIV